MLHNLTFEVRPGEKVGVLGRTGSGKSTLALSFFRFVDPAQGRILVDDLDISKVGLTDLRSRLTIIPRKFWRSVGPIVSLNVLPEDPTILSGTLRSTLDVFSEYEDADIVSILFYPPRSWLTVLLSSLKRFAGFTSYLRMMQCQTRPRRS